MGSLNFPIIPYRKKTLPTDISQGEDELSRRLFAGMGGGQAQEIPFEAMPLGDFTDGATTEKNLQRIGSQPFVKNVNFEPIVSSAPIVNNTGMFSPKAIESAPAIPRGMFGQSAEYDGQPPIASGLLPAPTPELSFNPMRVDTPNPRDLEVLRNVGAPSKVIAPSDALAPSIPLQRINVNQDAIDAGLSSADPRQFRAAQAMRTNYDESKPRSFLQKIGHHFAGAGRGVLEGLAAGGAGGGIAGAILGGINPRLATNLSNRRELAERLPENTQAEELKRRQQQQELQRQQQQSIESDRQERLALAQQRQREIEAERVRTNAEQAAAAKEKKETEGYKRNQDLINNRQQITKEDGTRLTMADLFTPKIDPETEKVIGNTGEIIQIGDKDVYRLPSAEQKQERELAKARAVGEANVANQVKAQAALAPGKILEGDVTEERTERREARREAERARKDAEKESATTTREARKAHSSVQAMINDATELDAKAAGLPDDDKNKVVMENLAKNKWHEAERAAAEAERQYPDHIEGRVGANEYPYVKFKEPTGSNSRPSAPGGTLSKQAGNYKAGDVVKYKGQRHKILRFENGNPVLDPNPIP
jgi:hypothetical protein